MGAYHRNGTLSVSSVKGLIEVSLLRLGGESRRGAATLDIDHYQRKFSHHCKSESLRLERQAGSGSGGHGKVACERCSDGGADSGYLILSLQCLCSETLVYGKFLKNTRGRSDGVRTAEKGQPGFLRCGEKAPGDSLIAGNVAVSPLLCGLDGLNGVGIRNRLHVGRIVDSVLNYLLVGLNHLGMLLCKLLLQIEEDGFQRSVEDVAGYAEGKHILAFQNGFLVHSAVLQALLRHSCDGSHDEGSVFHGKFREGIVRLETGLFHSGLVKSILIDENHSVAFAPFGVGLERRRIHRNEHITHITRSIDLGVAYVNLESGHSGNGAVRRTNLCGIVRESGKAVTVYC